MYRSPGHATNVGGSSTGRTVTFRSWDVRLPSRSSRKRRTASDPKASGLRSTTNRWTPKVPAPEIVIRLGSAPLTIHRRLSSVSFASGWGRAKDIKSQVHGPESSSPTRSGIIPLIRGVPRDS